ncbi:MAG TPA: VWA domain-containing protein [Terriglobia bacterium]|nr:VWA domain-containing protein [Terriglobia bacterium]
MIRRPQRILKSLALAAALGWLGVATLRAPAQQPAQSAGQQPVATAPGVIQAHANLVLVDLVATDHKGNYIEDLTQQDFKVYEDGKEQTVASFSRGENAGAPQGPEQQHYLVLFFDDSTMDVADQARARQAAAQFIDKTASEKRLMAVADFGGTLRIAQNFTANTDRLKKVVAGVKFSAVNPNDNPEAAQVAALGGIPDLGLAGDFGARNMLLAIRDLARRLQSVPGRKTVILFSSGFPLTPEHQSEMTAAVDACNRANVAIYPLDVRGLMTTMPGGPTTSPQIGVPPGAPANPLGPAASANEPLFPHYKDLFALLLDPQRGGGGGGTSGGGGGVGGGGGGGGRGGGGVGGGGGSTGGGGTGGGGRGGSGGTGTGGGGRGGSGGTGTGGGRGGSGGGTTGGGARGGGGGAINNSIYGNRNNPLYQPRQIIPVIPESATTNQQVLYALAAGTGGFPIFNSNDFLAGLDKIAKELNEYYILGYVPPAKNPEGACHTIKVKTERKGTDVRSRTGYCDVRSSDLLAAKPEGKALEAIATGAQKGNVDVSVRSPYFYEGPSVARVNLAVELPGEALSFEKEKGQFHSEVNVLGLVTREDGSVAARFSDKVPVEVDKKGMKEYAKGSFSYQNTFEVAPGKYTLKLVLGPGGDNIAKYEAPLVIDPYNGKQFDLSAVVLSNRITPVSELSTSLDAALMEDKTPLVVRGSADGKPIDFQLSPSPTNRFDRDGRVALYVEVYEPALLGVGNDARIGIQYSVVDRKTNQPAFRSSTILVNQFAQAGNPVIPVGTLLPLDKLQAGDYRLEVNALDSEGHHSPVRATDFVLN